MNDRLFATGALVDAADRDLGPDAHGRGWIFPIISVAVAGLALAVAAAHNLFGTIGGLLP